MSLMRWRFAAISGGTASSNAVSRGLSVLSDPARSRPRARATPRPRAPAPAARRERGRSTGIQGSTVPLLPQRA
jgi:hypothetical protein